MKRIAVVIDIYDEMMKHGLVEINSKELGIAYAATQTMDGLQSRYDVDAEGYAKQTEICYKIAELVKELDDIS